MLGHILNPRVASRSVLPVVSLLLLLGSVETSKASVYYFLTEGSQATVSSPEVILQNGTAGASTIYTNSTSAKASAAAPKTNNSEDYVDLLSDVDNSTDIGTHSNFTAQQYGPDLINDTLTEEDTGGTSMLELWVDNYDGTKHDWTTVGTTPYLSSINYPTDYIYTSITGGTEEKFDFANASATGAINDVKICVYTRTDGDEQLEISIHNSTDRYIVAQPTLSTSWTWYNYSCLPILPTWTQVNYAKLRLQMIKVGGSADVYVDAALVSVNYTSLNYELDLEVQWTNVDYDENSEYLCVYRGSMGSENITIDAWNGSAWKNVFADLSIGWNNKSVSSYLTSSDFAIRFKGANETDDVSQDSWNIDATLLHVWTYVEKTYDYVLRVNNTLTDPWEIRLKKYSNSSINRLENFTISFCNSTNHNSTQIVIENGSFNQTEGPWYDLGSLETIYIAMTVETNSTEKSIVRTYLEIRILGTTTYLQYMIAFEIT